MAHLQKFTNQPWDSSVITDTVDLDVAVPVMVAVAPVALLVTVPFRLNAKSAKTRLPLEIATPCASTVTVATESPCVLVVLSLTVGWSVRRLRGGRALQGAVGLLHPAGEKRAQLDDRIHRPTLRALDIGQLAALQEVETRHEAAGRPERFVADA